MKKSYRENIERSVKKGIPFSMFVHSEGINDKDLNKLAAYRQIAHEMGYEIGEYQHHAVSYTIIAPITRISPP